MPYYSTPEQDRIRRGWYEYAAQGRMVVHIWSTNADDPEKKLDEIVSEEYLRPGQELTEEKKQAVQTRLADIETDVPIKYAGPLNADEATIVLASLAEKLDGQR